MDINTLIKAISESFQQFFDEKRYKLIKFAVKVKIVDNVPIVLIFSKLVLTMAVDNETPRVDNVKTKKNKRKFSTYQRHIILLHFFI